MGDVAGQERQTGINLFTIAGIQITLDYSWFIIFLLILWSLSVGYFPTRYPDQPVSAYWFIGFVATICFFASILVHELSHAFTARRSGLKISSIRLFVFGGVAQISEEATNPKTEFKIAAVGPMTSFLLAGVFWLVKSALDASGDGLVIVMFEYLAWINLALAVFNLFPGFPLDGGRMFRALWWWKSGSLTQATRIAADIGKGFALALMILGGLQIFAGALTGGLWFLFIGMFLRGVAEGGYQELMVRQSLERVPVERLVIKDPVCVPPDLPIDRLVSDYFLRYGFGGFPIEKEGKVLGLVSLGNIKRLTEEERRSKKVADVMMPLDEKVRIAPRVSLYEALKKITREQVGRLLVMEDGKMMGMITRTGVLRHLEIRHALES